MTDEHAAAIATVTGLEVRGFARVMDSGEIIHLLRNHGVRQREVARGQAPIKKSDIARIGTIMRRSTPISHRKSAGGRAASIRSDASVGGWRYTVIEEVRPTARQLALKTMWKTKA